MGLLLKKGDRGVDEETVWWSRKMHSKERVAVRSPGTRGVLAGESSPGRYSRQKERRQQDSETCTKGGMGPADKR